MRYKHTHPRPRGASTVELALLVPVLFICFSGLIQLVIYLQSLVVVNYAAFAAGRAFHVYGDRPLESISYPHVRNEPWTHSQQTIAEAAAEKVIFESLLWEQRRIEVDGDHRSMRRYYEDGEQTLYDGSRSDSSFGAVQINFKGCQRQAGCPQGTEVEILYCMPIVFLGADMLFSRALKEWPCQVSAFGKSYRGVGLVRSSFFKREPLTP